jgi:drug/metabolite transporter (DMT)-like permease
MAEGSQAINQQSECRSDIPARQRFLMNDTPDGLNSVPVLSSQNGTKPMVSPKSASRGLLLSLLGFALYSSHDVLVKHLGEFYSPFQILFFAVLFSFPLVTLYVLRTPRTGSLWPHYPILMFVRVLAVSLTGFCAFYAFSALALAQAYALLFLTPILITALSVPVLGEKVGLHRWGAVLVGFIGVMLVLQPNYSGLNGGYVAGIGAALGSAVNSLITRQIGQREKTEVMLLYPLIGNFLIMGCALPFVYVPMPLVHLAEISLISLLGLIAMFCIVIALQKANAGVVAPMQYSQIIWAGVFGAVFFDQQLTRGFVIGAALIVASGLYIVRREWTRTDSMQPVLSNGTFGPDNGVRPAFALSRVFMKRKK